MGNRTIFLVGLWLIGICCHGQQQIIRVACIGNSVTYGWGLEIPAQTAYPAVLQQQLGSSYHVENFGHPGATLLRRGHRPYLNTPAFRDMLQFKPDIAVILLGLNDTDPRDFPHYRDDFIADYNALVDTIRKQQPGVRIFIGSLTPIFTGHDRFLSSTRDWYLKIQTKIRAVADLNQLPLIDFNKALHNRSDLFTDQATLHPNEKGTALMADLVYRHISGRFGGLQLPPLFTDHMVLQRQAPIKIWGTADAGSEVSVRFLGQKRKVVAGYNGKWQVQFPASKARHQPQEIEIKDRSKTICLSNILIGDVWLCSGQSNMYFPLAQAQGGDSMLRLADPSQSIRLFKYTSYAQTDRQAWPPDVLSKANNLDFFSGVWQLSDTKAAASFSAVGYVFGSELYRQTNIPIGLIEVAVGGSPLISWVSRAALESDPFFTPAFKNWRQSDYITIWCRERANLNLKNAESVLQRHPYEPAFNFEAGIEKLIPYPIKGVIWYQGESDADLPENYQRLFPLLVQDWRQQWQIELPFYYVQLSSLNRPSWNHFRDIQRRLLKQVSHSGMVVTSDLGDESEVHYKDKIPVGHRLALLALRREYGRPGLASGPLVHAVERKGNQIRVRFDFATGLSTRNNEALTGFEILTHRGAYLPVPASIKNDEVWITIPGKLQVKKLAYAWRPFTRANLVNGQNLPASTFIEPLK